MKTVLCTPTPSVAELYGVCRRYSNGGGNTALWRGGREGGGLSRNTIGKEREAIGRAAVRSLEEKKLSPYDRRLFVGSVGWFEEATTRDHIYVFHRTYIEGMRAGLSMCRYSVWLFHVLTFLFQPFTDTALQYLM